MPTINTLLTDALAPALVSTAIDVAVRVAVVLGIAAIATRMLWRSSAALRHSLWTAALAGAFVLPVLALVLPAVRLPIPGASAARSLATRIGGALGADAADAADVSVTGQRVASGVHEVTAQTSARSEELQLAAAAAAAATVPTTAPVHVTLTGAPSRLGWTAIVTLIWIGGALLALIPLLLGMLQLRAIGRRARDVESDALDDYAARLGRSLGIGRVVRVVEGEAVATPMTWGIVAPVVMVPAGFSEWPEPRQRDVLLHELAHVARYDCLTQYLASVVCALHWYNPLAWIAARNLRIERERACDDRVLLAGARASEYAEHLLTIARTLRTPGAAGAAALAMARPSHLEGRLLAVLDGGRRRAVITRGRAALVGGATFLVVALVAALAPWSARRAEAGEPDQGRFLPPGNYMTPIDTDSVAIRDSSRRDGGTTRQQSRATTNSRATTADTSGVKIVQHGAGSTIVLNTGPNATDPSRFAIPGCPIGKSPSSSAEVLSSDNEHLRARVKRGDCQILLEREGEVGYNATFTDVVSLDKDGWFEISDKGGAAQHKLRIVANDNGALSRTWSIDGTKMPYDAAAAAWLRETMLELDRYTDFSNGARMAAVFKEKGANGVLDETANTEGDYGKRTQIEKLLKMARLDHAQTERILGFAKDDMHSDYEKSQMLQALLKQDLIDPTLQLDYVAAAATISSDYERRQALSALADAGKLTPAGQVATYNAAKSVSSSYERRQLIGSVAEKYGLTQATAPAFTAAAESMDSDYDLRTMLIEILAKQPNLDSGVFENFLSIASRRISSDYDKAEFLISAARSRPNTEAERERIAKAAESINSESDYGRVLASLRRMKNNSRDR